MISLLAAGISTNNLEDSRNEEWLKAGASHDIDEVAPLNSLRKEERKFHVFLIVHCSVNVDVIIIFFSGSDHTDCRYRLL